MARIPTLDGWRGVAILLVIASHLQSGLLNHVWRYNWMDLGKHGVTIFFVLSGFLITSRILAESPFRLTDFYKRRFFRLAPVVLVYLGVIALLSLTLRTHLTGGLWGCLFLFRNYIPENPSNALTSHFWSLSIEEQFYLLWPLALVFAGRRRSLWIAAIMAGSLALLRLEHWQRYLLEPLRSEARMDALLVGCVLAIALQNPGVRERFIRHDRVATLLAAAVLLFSIWRFQTLMPLYESAAIAVFLGQTSSRPGGLLARVLQRRPLETVGVLSYSLYIWQELFLVPHWRALTPFMFALLFLTAYASYHLIERPCIALAKARPPASLNSRQHNLLPQQPTWN